VTVVLRAPGDLTLETLEAVAWHGERIEIDPDLAARIDAARERMLAALDTGEPVYGVTTGMGYLAGASLDEAAQRAHSLNLLVGRQVGGPPWLSRAEARALIAVRLAGFLGGEAGVSSALCRFLADRLNDGFTPAVPRTGAGSAGEIIPLAHAFGPMAGVGLCLREDGGTEDAAEALHARGVPPYVPSIKEGIALIAGAPGAVALGAARLRAGRVLARQALIAAACAIDAIRAPLDPYHPSVAELAADPVLASVLARLNVLLEGSSETRHRLQAPVSYRVAPQVQAHLARTLERLEEDVRRALRAVADSPAFVDKRFLSTGNFHAISLATDLDVLCIALAQTAELSGQRMHRLLDARFSGLPDQLTPSPGPMAGLVAVHKRAAGTLNELRRLAMPASVGLIDTSMGQEDAMTFGFEAAEKVRHAEELTREVLACELLCCRQAWFLRGEAPAAGLRELMVPLLEITPVERDRALGRDVARVIRMLEAMAV
jgi:histidine ammonia-lyase